MYWLKYFIRYNTKKKHKIWFHSRDNIVNVFAWRHSKVREFSEQQIYTNHVVWRFGGHHGERKSVSCRSDYDVFIK